jgi:hypothetical protein
LALRRIQEGEFYYKANRDYFRVALKDQTGVERLRGYRVRNLSRSRWFGTRDEAALGRPQRFRDNATDTRAAQYPAAWPNGRLLPVVLQSDPQGRFPKNGQCITEGRSPGDCSHPSELQSPDDPGRPVEISRQLSGSRISIITTVAARLLVGEEVYRHQVISFRAASSHGRCDPRSSMTCNSNQPLVDFSSYRG